MRKMFCLIVLSTIVSTVFSQPTTSIQTDYLQKSKKQKTAAFVLLSGGAVLVVVGTAIGVSRWDDEIVSIVDEGEDDKSYMAGGIMMVTGLAAMVGSVPLFIASARNKRKAHAASASIKLETMPVVYRQGISKLPYPAACIRINL
jgi:hypothetical protein